ncbi:MAG: hypothetical protein Q8N26_38505 [Myxococcales bacterium]|nr:hypothetical protein [Myxococcales bacterium]
MLTAQVLALVLTASPLTEPSPSAPEPQLSSARAARFAGALLGGLVGFAVPLTVSSVTAAPCVGCVDTAQVLLGASAPVLSMVGASLGFALMGGEASAGVASLGLVAGMLLSLVFLVVGSELIADSLAAASVTPLPKLLLLVGAGALTVGTQALFLSLRDDAVRADPAKTSPTRRVALTVTAAALTSLVAVALAGFASLLPFPLNVVSGFGGLGLGLAMPLIPFAVHKGQGGAGSLLSAYAGWLVMAGAGALGGLLLTQSGGLRTTPLNNVATATVIGTAAVLASVAVPLMLEWSHHAADAPPVVESVTASLAPIPGGGQVMLGGRF